jgi:RNA polymerase sigma-70 factor (ECF subfamily)
MSLDAVALTAAYETHRAYLWGLGYRLLGTADDADDVLQETFVRLIESPPADPAAPLVPWLVRAAADLARAALRERQARDYPGVWLPGPVQTQRLEIPGIAPRGDYGLAESASYAFLVALEVLDTDARAAVILRDVFDLPPAEAAAALATDEAAVEALRQRARAALEPHDTRRRRLDAELTNQTADALAALLAALQADDAQALGALMTAEVRGLTDAAGERGSAPVPLLGRDAVAAHCLELARSLGSAATFLQDSFNGLPALVAQGGPGDPGQPERGILRVELDASGSIREVHSVLAVGKLGALWGYGVGD